MQMFHNVVSFIICCAKEARASIVMNVNWMSAIGLEKLWKLLNCILPEVC